MKKYLFGIVSIFEYGMKKDINSEEITYHKTMDIKLGKLIITWKFY